MGWFDWLMGGGNKKRRTVSTGSATARSTTGHGGTTEKTAPRGATTPRPGGVVNRQVFRSDKENSQARDVLKDWLKDD